MTLPDDGVGSEGCSDSYEAAGVVRPVLRPHSLRPRDRDVRGVDMKRGNRRGTSSQRVSIREYSSEYI